MGKATLTKDELRLIYSYLIQYQHNCESEIKYAQEKIDEGKEDYRYYVPLIEGRKIVVENINMLINRLEKDVKIFSEKEKPTL